ncbi:hypothetical protein ACPCBF_25265 [Streptomyces pseudogriseolus]|uniref:hypothetical protein n=1 Tax=Streptomyces pseudogriseolus TaxID=36817 RepID=UPI003FA321BC
MTPEDTANRYRQEIAFRGSALSNFPEGHPARELFLRESAELADLVAKEEQARTARDAESARREATTTRVIGAAITVLGVALAAWDLTDGGLLMRAGLCTTVLGALVIYGASEADR